MSDIVERIRGLRFVHVPGTSQLMEEAAVEIERLRLTAEERDAILAMACYCDTRASLQHQKWASTFRIMLEVRK